MTTKGIASVLAQARVMDAQREAVERAQRLALSVPCPKCGSAIDQPCKTTAWRRVIERPPHTARKRALRGA